MLKVKIIHLMYAQAVFGELQCKPSIGDNLPIIKVSDTVKKVSFVTPLMIKEHPDLKDCALLICIE